MKTDFHRLLKRQINRYIPEAYKDKPGLLEFYKAIDQAYRDWENDKSAIERTLEISSSELSGANKMLNRINEELERKVMERTEEFERVNQSLIQEIITRQAKEMEMQRTDRLLRAVNKAIGVLVTEPEYTKAISQAFACIGAEADVDRVVLYENFTRQGERFFSHRLTWNRSGEIEQDRRSSQKITYESAGIKDLIVSLDQGAHIVKGNLEDFDEPLQKFMRTMGITSIIMVPVFAGQNHWGTIGFANTSGTRKWSQIEENILVSMANAIGGMARQKEYEQHLLGTKKELLEAQQNAFVGSFDVDFFDHTSRFTEQAAFLLGYKPEDLCYDKDFIKKLRKNVFPEDLRKIDEHWQKAMETRGNITLDLRVKHPNGNEYYLNWLVKMHFTRSGELQKVTGTLQDITERVRSQTQLIEYAKNLEKINKELDQFAYIVSHDLKAPLRAINNLSTWIEEDIEAHLNDDTRKNFDMLRARIRRMESLINGILEYSRAGRLKAEDQLVNMNSFLQDIVANLSPPEHFKIEIQQGIPDISLEKIAIDQVFSNFISNAIKYNNNPEPIIKVSYEELEQMHQFCVEDNGPGIEEQFHDKIFVIFQTLQARDQVESTGVGLAIVKKIIEEKGGKVWVESSKGQGSRFFFTLSKS